MLGEKHGRMSVNAVHLICRREGMTFKGLEPVQGKRLSFRSCCWAFSDAEARSLIGGWIYLHPISKSERSEFGGLVIDVHPAKRVGTATEEGYAFIFEAKPEGRGQHWRGRDHAMAWTGGIVAADFDHEKNNA
jgi:hypothetical protein